LAQWHDPGQTWRQENLIQSQVTGLDVGFGVKDEMDVEVGLGVSVGDTLGQCWNVVNLEEKGEDRGLGIELLTKRIGL
jgi:hypothetical protein